MQEKEEVDHLMDQSFQVPEFLLKSHSDLTEVEVEILLNILTNKIQII